MSALRDGPLRPISPGRSDAPPIGAVLVEQGVVAAIRALAERSGRRPRVTGTLPRLAAEVELTTCLVAEEWLRDEGAVSLDIRTQGSVHQLVFAAPVAAPAPTLVQRIQAIGGSLLSTPPAEHARWWILTLPRD